MKVKYVIAPNFQMLQGHVNGARRLPLPDGRVLARCEVDDRQQAWLEDHPEMLVVPSLEASVGRLNPQLLSGASAYVDPAALGASARAIDLLRAIRAATGIPYRSFPIE